MGDQMLRRAPAAFLLALSLAVVGGTSLEAAPVRRKAARTAARKTVPVRAPRAGAKAAPSRAVPTPALVSLHVYPPRIALEGPRARQLLVVTGVYRDGSRRDLSRRVSYRSENPGVAAVSADGRVTPARDGTSAIRVTAGKSAVRVPVSVSESRAPAPPSFVREIVPILTQAGCNSLSCHGSPAGKAGFKLSMYGAEPALDLEALVKQERTAGTGKRVDPAAAERSLVLQKPTMQLPHQGGMRFKRDSPEYRTLLAWVRAGAPAGGDVLPALRELEIHPAEQIFAPGETQRLAVTARYSDGFSEDVTHKGVFFSNDDAVAAVEADGAVTARGVGETTVLARYLGRVGQAQMLVPQPGAVPAAELAKFRPLNYVDQLALAKWRKMRFAPSGLSTDSEFLRRVSIDLTGTLPTPAEIRAFLADSAPDKRARKVEELLARPEYADWWTVFWGDLLRNNSRFLQLNGAKTYHAWIRQSVAENKPYDRFVRELVTATGQTFAAGPPNFYRVAATAPDRAEQVSQLFLGVRLQCANCHNHPFEKWTRVDYHRFAALFARVRSQGRGNRGTEISVQPRGDYRFPGTNQVLSPAVLPFNAPEEQAAEPAEGDRREALAEWLVSPRNPLFARNLVNRLWAQLFGRGLVDPVDDLRVTNPASNEALLDALARDFVARGFDVKHVLRTIAGSRTYQLSVRATPLNARDTRNFSRAYYRRLKAEALLDAVCQATNVPEDFRGYPKGTRSIQLIDNRVGSYFMDIFGRPRREIVCACEREETANLTQALHFINGATVNEKIRTGRVAELVRSGKADSEILDELYLWTVSRLPRPEEKRRALEQIAAAGSRQQALEDRMWVLLNSREFLFNH